MSPTFVTPVAYDGPSTTVDMTEEERALWRFYEGRERGRTVIKVGGTYSTVDIPTQEQLAACDAVLWPDGTRAPEFYLGGHTYYITDAQATALAAAGYSVDVSGGYGEGYGGGF